MATENVPRGRLMRCPHCQEVSGIVWTGFGSEWVLCHRCQRRLRWFDVEANYLLREDRWEEGTQADAAYH